MGASSQFGYDCNNHKFYQNPEETIKHDKAEKLKELKLDFLFSIFFLYCCLHCDTQHNE